MIQANLKLSPVHYNEDPDSGYAYPDAGMTSPVDVKVLYSHREAVSASTVVKLGGHLFTLTDLKRLIKEADCFVDSAVMYEESLGNSNKPKVESTNN